LSFLALNDRRFMAETIAICGYLEERQLAPVLIGNTPKKRPETRVSNRDSTKNGWYQPKAFVQ
jgi:glutathione S-transferase